MITSVSGPMAPALKPVFDAVKTTEDLVNQRGDVTVGASLNIPTEVLESTISLFVEKVELIQGSGGAGKHRGGLGSNL